MMNSAPYQQRLAALRDDDRRLDDCLAQFEVLMSTWLTAVREAHTAFMQGVELRLSRPDAAAVAAQEPEATEPAASAEMEEALDGEALLATLDAETANAIRVRRRLSHGSKTVRQLLEEVREAQAAAVSPNTASPKQRKQRWWRRSDE